MENKKTNRAEQLQFLRFIAFLFIFMWHANAYHLGFMPSTGAGAMCAVSFFFILSGFVTGYSSYNNEQKLGIKEIKKEMWKKIKRFYPLYIGITLFSIVFSTLPGEIATHNLRGTLSSTLQLAKNTLLIQSWFPSKYFAFVSGGWFLSTLMFLYLFNVPLRVLLNKIGKNKFRYLILILMFIVTISLAVCYCYAVRSLNAEFYNYVFPISRLGEYISGMIAGFAIVIFLNEANINEKLQGKLVKCIFTVLEILALVFWVKCIYTPNTIGWIERIVRWLLPNFVLIIVFAFGKGLLSELFKGKIFVVLGDMSFECFLLHALVVTFYKRVSGVENVTDLGNLFSILTCFAITLTIAYFIHGRPFKIVKDVEKNQKLIDNKNIN